MTKNCGFVHYSHLSLPFHTLQSDSLNNMDVIRATSVNNGQAIVSLKGRTFAFDNTELQAKAIIFYATKEIDQEIMKSKTDRVMECDQLYSSMGFSIKRSLKRFLQRRKLRSQISSPYSQ